MFEGLEKLRPELDVNFSGLSPFSSGDATAVVQKWPSCPSDYLVFLAERGWGPLKQNGDSYFFIFAQKFLSAETEYYQDRLIYDYGAKGDIMIFGWESMEIAYGFDTGAGWQLVEVDEFRIVTALDLSFRLFVEGLLICFPQIAVRYEDGAWFDGTGRSYRL